MGIFKGEERYSCTTLGHPVFWGPVIPKLSFGGPGCRYGRILLRKIHHIPIKQLLFFAFQAQKSPPKVWCRWKFQDQRTWKLLAVLLDGVLHGGGWKVHFRQEFPPQKLENDFYKVICLSPPETNSNRTWKWMVGRWLKGFRLKKRRNQKPVRFGCSFQESNPPEISKVDTWGEKANGTTVVR